MRDRIIKSKRSMLTMSIAAGIGLALFMPISSTVSVVGVVHADREVNVYAPFPAKLIELNVTDRAYVKKDEVLAVFESEELELKASLLEKKVALLRQRIDRGAADFVDGANRLVLESELAGEVEELKNLSMQRERLVLRAEIEGVVADLSTAIHTGRYIDQSSPLFRLLSPSGVGVVGLVNEVHLERLKPGSSATFYPDDLMLEALPVTLKKINASSTRALSFPSMAIKFGGTVPTQPAASPASPEEVMGSFYGLEFSPVATSGFGYDRTQRGVLHLDAEPQSLASRAIERVISVAIRETGF